MGKDIDNIYRTRFREARMSPPEDSWENILAQMPQKGQKRRLFPFWLKFAGAAAFLALFFGVYLSNSSSPLKEEGGFVASTAPKWDFSMPIVSGDFNEIMKESGIMLQAVILQHWEDQSLESQQHSVSAGAEASGDKVLPDSSNRSFQSPAGPEIETAENTLAAKNSEVTGELQEEALPEISEVKLEEAVAVVPKNDELQEKFKLSTRFAPVYSSNFGKSSALTQGIAQKEGYGEVTFSYGVSVAYAVAKNVNIRSGINKVNLEYTTRNISFNEIAGASSFAPKIMSSTTLASPAKGSLNQKVGFLEVPLEVEYLLLDKEFSVGLIGGGSILFLEENELLLDLSGNQEDLGEANSMNNLSYTANLGLGLGYNLSKQLQLSFEPVFKFQMNSLKNSDGQKPYFFGLYSGFSYKF